MDANKLQKLKDIGYTIKASCGTCKYFQHHQDEHFGECDKHEYTHLKHSGGKRKLSVVMYGSCDKYEATNLSFLHGFMELVQPKHTIDCVNCDECSKCKKCGYCKCA